MGVDIGRYASEEAEPREGVDCEIPELGERNIFFIRVWKPLPTTFYKLWREAQKEKPKDDDIIKAWTSDDMLARRLGPEGGGLRDPTSEKQNIFL